MVTRNLESVKLPLGNELLLGDLTVVPYSRATLIFAHGSGSGRNSIRNRSVAEQMQEAGFSTLLFDLLTEREQTIDDRTGSLRFDIPLLAQRVMRAMNWVRAWPETSRSPIGLYGASTGAAAALLADAAKPGVAEAIVSRGGRPDLLGPRLAEVRAPSLLIVGALDTQVLAWNRTALARMGCEKDLAIVEGAGHLFEEPGALQEVTRLTLKWFGHYLNGNF